MARASNYYFQVFGAGLLGGGIASSLYLKGLHFENSEMAENGGVTMSYADMAALMLGAVGVLVTVLGVFMAILALWGYSQFKVAASNAALDHVKSELEEGQLRDELNKLLVQEVIKQMDDGKLRRILEERADRFLISGPSIRANEDDNDNPMGDEEKEYGV